MEYVSFEPAEFQSELGDYYQIDDLPAFHIQYYENIEDANLAVQMFESKNGFHFVTTKQSKSYGQIEIPGT